MATKVAPSLQEYLEDANYPSDKENLLTRAREQGVGADDLAMLGRLPEQSFMTPVDVSLALAELDAGRRPARRSRAGGSGATGAKERRPQPTSRPQPNMKSEATEATNRVARRVGDVTKEQLETRQREIATQITHAAESLRLNEQQFRTQGDAVLADVAGAGAMGLEQAADFLGTNDIDAVAQAVESAVRRRPIVVVGVAVAVGFVASRFLKAGIGGPPSEQQVKNQNER